MKDNNRDDGGNYNTVTSMYDIDDEEEDEDYNTDGYG